MTRKLVITFVLAAVLAAVALPASAGVRATLILTSGEKVKGVLVDMGGADFTMMEGGNEIRIPLNDVAVIDFVGGGQTPASEVAKMQGGRAVVFQRNGDAFYGRLYDIGGDSPLVFTFNSSDGQLELNSNEISRVYLRRWEGMPQGNSGGGGGSASSGGSASGGGGGSASGGGGSRQSAERPQPGVSIPATGGWVDTGIQVRSGQWVTFSASGQVVLSGDGTDTAGPGGAHNGRVAAGGAQLPGVAAGALVGRVGRSAAFGIGTQTQALSMPASGVIFLAVNDENPNDNRGEYRVQMTIVR